MTQQASLSLTTDYGLRTSLFCIFHRPRLADDSDLHLSGVIQLLFNGLGDDAADADGIAVGGLGGIGDDAHLSAGLDGIGVFDAGETRGDRLQLLEPFDVLFQRFAAGAGTRGANRIGGGDQHRVDMVDRDVVMVAEDGVQDLLAGFPVALGQLGADLGMAALHFMIGRLADVVQQAATPRQLAVQSELFRHHAAQVRDFQAVLEHVLTVTGSKLQPAEKLHELFMDRVHADVEDGLLAELENVLLHLLLRLLDNLLDARGMDAAVLNLLAQRETGYLAADYILCDVDQVAVRVVIYCMAQ